MKSINTLQFTDTDFSYQAHITFDFVLIIPPGNIAEELMDKKYLLIGCLCAIFVLAGIFSMLLKPDNSLDSRRLQDFYTVPIVDCCSGFDNTSMNISDDTNDSTYDVKTVRNVTGSRKVT